MKMQERSNARPVAVFEQDVMLHSTQSNRSLIIVYRRAMLPAIYEAPSYCSAANRACYFNIAVLPLSIRFGVHPSPLERDVSLLHTQEG